MTELEDDLKAVREEFNALRKKIEEISGTLLLTEQAARRETLEKQLDARLKSNTRKTFDEAHTNTEPSSLYAIRDKFFEDVASALVQIGQKWLSLSATQQGLSER